MPQPPSHARGRGPIRLAWKGQRTLAPRTSKGFCWAVPRRRDPHRCPPGAGPPESVPPPPPAALPPGHAPVPRPPRLAGVRPRSAYRDTPGCWRGGPRAAGRLGTLSPCGPPKPGRSTSLRGTGGRQPASPSAGLSRGATRRSGAADSCQVAGAGGAMGRGRTGWETSGGWPGSPGSPGAGHPRRGPARGSSDREPSAGAGGVSG